MSGILNIGVRSLLVDQSALQVISNNIANVNTPGYSRQSVILQDVAGQFSGSGYFGKGVDITTVQRIYSDFLTKQAAAAQSTAAADSTRSDKLTQLETLFQGGTDGLGATVSNMLNAFSDIVSAPTDLTARSVALSRANDMATRFKDTASQLNDLKVGTASQLATDVDTINNLANQIAQANDQIARATGTGHSPNDLLDQRDQLIRELNKYVRTTNIPADDGSVGIFLATSQPLVLGTTVSPVSLGADPLGDPDKAKLVITVGGTQKITLDEATLGGGEVSGLLRFQNTDLVEAGNLLGRMALAIGTKMNEQQGLGLDLNGAAGQPLFNLSSIHDAYPASTNSMPGATLAVTVQTNPSGTTSLQASDYELKFTTGSTGTITRLSDGVTTAFNFGTTNPLQIDGLNIQNTGTAAAGDSFVIKPFTAAANSITTAFSSPAGLAMANPIAARAGLSNAGTLSLDSLVTRSVPAPPAVTLTFTGAGTYTRSDTGATTYTYTPGVPIEYSAAVPPTTGWSLTLKGTPQAGDTYTVQSNPYPANDGGNAQAMLDLRDLKMFDGGPLTDGYASLMSQIGIKVQGAKSAASVSTNIATTLEKDRTSVSGVNLDEEAAKMLQFQQAYQASGKMLQISQNIFDTLIQSLG